MFIIESELRSTVERSAKDNANLVDGYVKMEW